MQISVGQDGTPSVTLSMLDEKILKENEDERNPHHHRRDLQYMLNSDMASRISLSFKDYASSGIKVGDKVSVEVTKLREARPKAVNRTMDSKNKSETN